MGFIRVRSAKGPAHEFDVSEAAYNRNRGAFKVIDRKPVAVPRPAVYVQAMPVVDAGRPAGEES